MFYWFLVICLILYLLNKYRKHRKAEKEAEREAERKEEALQWWDALDTKEKVQYILNKRASQASAAEAARRWRTDKAEDEKFMERMYYWDKYGKYK